MPSGHHRFDKSPEFTKLLQHFPGAQDQQPRSRHHPRPGASLRRLRLQQQGPNTRGRGRGHGDQRMEPGELLNVTGIARVKKGELEGFR